MGCSRSAWDDNSGVPPVSTVIKPVQKTPTFDADEGTELLPDRLTPSMTRLPERVPPENQGGMRNEVPESILTDIVQDWSSRTGNPEGMVEIISAESIIWPDGSLGCPRPGQAYTQAPVPGYRVVLSAESQTYSYHANERGFFFLCEGSSHPGANPSPSR